MVDSLNIDSIYISKLEERFEQKSKLSKEYFDTLCRRYPGYSYEYAFKMYAIKDSLSALLPKPKVIVEGDCSYLTGYYRSCVMVMQSLHRIATDRYGDDVQNVKYFGRGALRWYEPYFWHFSPYMWERIECYSSTCLEAVDFAEMLREAGLPYDYNTVPGMANLLERFYFSLLISVYSIICFRK